jgi:hypothetical protein
MPPGLRDRTEDAWEPLVAIADLAGGGWPDRARAAAPVLMGSDRSRNVSLELLMDIQAIFDQKKVLFLSSKTLLAALASLDGQPWADWKHGRPMSDCALARQLKPFEIFPTSDGHCRGYARERFVDAWARYTDLNPSTRQSPNKTATQSAKSARQAGVATDGLKSENTAMNTGSVDGLTSCNPDQARASVSEPPARPPGKGGPVAESRPLRPDEDPEMYGI